MDLRNLPPRYRQQAERQLRTGRPVAAASRPDSRKSANALSPSAVRSATPNTKPFGIVTNVRRSADGNALQFDLDLDPSTFRTAQHKGNQSYIGKDGKAHVRYFKKPAVANSYKPVTTALSYYRSLTLDWSPEDAIAVDIVFRYPYPKDTAKKRLIDDHPHTQIPDVDNVGKELLDSVTAANLWRDDSKVFFDMARKVRTTGKPSVSISMVRNPAKDALPPSLFDLYVRYLERNAPPKSQDTSSLPANSESRRRADAPPRHAPSQAKVLP